MFPGNPVRSSGEAAAGLKWVLLVSCSFLFPDQGIAYALYKCQTIERLSQENSAGLFYRVLDLISGPRRHDDHVLASSFVTELSAQGQAIDFGFDNDAFLDHDCVKVLRLEETSSEFATAANDVYALALQVPFQYVDRALGIVYDQKAARCVARFQVRDLAIPTVYHQAEVILDVCDFAIDPVLDAINTLIVVLQNLTRRCCRRLSG
jgi:hypothetical protein